MVPILINNNDFKERVKARHAGKLGEWQPEKQTTKMPAAFIEWVKDNPNKVNNPKTAPFFIRDNYKDGNVAKGLNDRIANLAAIVQQAKQTAPEPAPAPFKRATVNELKAAGIQIFRDEEPIKNLNFDFIGLKKEIEEIAKQHNIEGATCDFQVTGLAGNDSSEIQIRAIIKDKNGHQRLNIIRTIRKNGVETTCSHDLFTLDKSLQGQGISKKLFAKLYTEYQRAGVDKLEVCANMDVGGYTWTRYGFATDKDTALQYAIEFQQKMKSREMWLKFKEFYNTHDEKKTFPMNLFSEVEGAKEFFSGRKWKGVLDLRNAEQTRVFEEYIGVNNKTGYASTKSSGKEPLTPTKIQDISDVETAMAKFVDKHPEYFTKGYKGIVAVSEKKAFMSATMDGIIKINFAANKDGYNAGESLLRAIDKLNNGEELTRDEEYAVESLWHEILHNKSKNTTILPDINEPDKGFTRAVAETINQLVARHTYGENLLTELGGKPKHQQWVLEKGYSYDATLDNLRLLLQKAGINEAEFVERANKILMQDYTDIDKKIVKLLTEMNKNKKLDVARAFGFIEIKDFERFC